MPIKCEGCGEMVEALPIHKCRAPVVTAEVDVLLSQFIIFMQNQNIWPCILEIGEAPRMLNARQVIELKNSFKAEFSPSKS